MSLVHSKANKIYHNYSFTTSKDTKKIRDFVIDPWLGSFSAIIFTLWQRHNTLSDEVLLLQTLNFVYIVSGNERSDVFCVHISTEFLDNFILAPCCCVLVFVH